MAVPAKVGTAIFIFESDAAPRHPRLGFASFPFTPRSG